MKKRILASLLAIVMIFSLSANVWALEAPAPVTQKVTAQTQDSVTLQLFIPGGADSGSGRLVYTFPEELTLKSAKSLVGSTGVSNLSTTGTTVSFAWASYEDYTVETAILELTFTGAPGAYEGSIELPELGIDPIPVTIELKTPYRFVDVTDESKWYFSYVYEAYDLGLMVGMGQDRFAPGENVTRAQMATMLYRMAGSPAPAGENPFTDVPAGKWYTNAVTWAAENKIVYGYGNCLFIPGGSITREEAVTMLARFAAYSGAELENTAGSKTFTDEASISRWAKDAVKLCAGAGIVEGYPDGSFRPKGLITRAEVAKIMVVFHGCLPKEPAPPEPTTPTEPDPTEPPTPTEPAPAYTVTFVGDQGYAKVDGEKVDAVTLEPGQTWLTFSLFGDKSQGFELDDVQVTAGTLSKNGSAFVLKNIDRDVTVSFTTKDMVLTVKFVSAQTATIEPASVQVPWGGTVTPATATRDGYGLEGWYTEPTFENQFDFSQPVYESVTLYAKWGARYYTVSFMDGEEVLFTQEVRYGARVERPASPEKEGFLFAGWYADPELTTAYNFYSAIHEDTRIYASWLVDDRSDYIYLGGNESGNTNYGVLGDDANDGSSVEQAVRTFERAKELLKDAKNPVILLCGTMTLTEDTTWSMADLPGGKVVRAASGFTTAGIIVEPGVTLTMDHLILDGGTEMFPSLQTASILTHMISLEDADSTSDTGGSLILNEGVVIQNCGNQKSTTGAIYGWGCNTVVMNDGVKILNNTGNYTGGMSVSSGSTVILNAVEFSGNQQVGTTASLMGANGSALRIYGTSEEPSSLVINGATFTNNTAGVGATINVSGNILCQFNGGTVTGNTSGGASAGIGVGDKSKSDIATLSLNGCTIRDNTSGEGFGNCAVNVMKAGKVVLNGAKDDVDMDGIYVAYTDGASGTAGIYAAKPLSYVKGGGIDVYYDGVDINTVLLRGYGTYLLTEADTQACRLQSGLDSTYYTTLLDPLDGAYKVAYSRNIGSAVYLSGTKGSDENDGLTPDTPVATFDRAKAVLKANLSGTGENVIFIMQNVTIPADTTQEITMEDIPNGAILRYTTNSSYFFYVYGTANVHDVVLDGNRQAFPYSSTHSAMFRVDKGGTLNLQKGTVARNMRGSSQSVVYVYGAKDTVNTVNVDDLTVASGIESYVTTMSETSGPSIFFITGAAGGTVNLTVNGGTITGNEARLLYVTYNSNNHLVFNDCTFSGNEVLGPGAVFLGSYTANVANTVLDINGGTYTNNRSASTSASYGYGGIAYLKLQTEVNFSGGTFTGNEASPLTGARGDGITLRSPGTKYTATVNLNKLNQDITLLLYDQSKSLNNTWAVITGPLTHTVTVYSQYPTDGFVVAKGTEDYTLTEADLAKLIPTAEGVTFRLDTENNAICISAG